MMAKNATLKHLFGYILLLIFVIFMLFNFSDFKEFIDTLKTILAPFIAGGILAFVLNVPLRSLERKVFCHVKAPWFKKAERLFGILISLFLVSLMLYLLGRNFIPQLINSTTLFLQNSDSYRDGIIALLRHFPSDNQHIAGIISEIEKYSLADMGQRLLGFLISGAGADPTSLNTAVSSTFGVVTSLATIMLNLLIAVFFAIYSLMSKERLICQGKKIIYALFNRKYADYIMHVFKTAFWKFHGFITGQLTEAVILGSLAYIGMRILQLPLAGMISALIMFTAIIPIAGAFIGGFVGALLIAPFDPIKAVIFIIFLVILQQFEGNVIYPRVVGGSVDLPSMWTLFAITIGGAMFGLVGMLVFVPLVATIYALFSEFICKRLDEKEINIEEIP